MAAQWVFLVILVSSILLLVLVTPSTASSTRQVYIVYMGEKPDESITHEHHVNILRDIVESNKNDEIAHEDLLIHSYRRGFHGFAAMLTEREAQKLSEMDSVVSIFPSRASSVKTTKSWNFLGFPEDAKKNISLAQDVIIGVIDTGVWPESPSFSDDGYGPPPKRWKGICQGNGNFTCNNKIIGARYYPHNKNIEEEYDSPRDKKGHGTHTASTIVGNLVPNVSQNGLGLGTARGGVPSARIAVYKACWDLAKQCEGADILAAFNDAIADGVDIISLSLGNPLPKRYADDEHAIGSFHATMKGILVSAGAGNSGPAKQTIVNSAPWQLTVAAVNTNRRFLTKVELGNGKIYEGIVPNTFDLEGKFYPLIYGGDAPNTKEGSRGSSSRSCFTNSLDEKKVHGKILLCDQGSKDVFESPDGLGAIPANAVGVLLTAEKNFDADIGPFPIAAAHIGLEDNSNIYQYINKTGNPTATIHKSEEIDDPLAPYVPVYSSRGPNPVNADLLKPDIAAPGTEILAAYPPTYDGETESNYHLETGTSMACPHVSAIAAYVKSFHPDWSPAAIRSAIMTTAKPMSPKSTPLAEFGYGAGLLNPSSVLNPGLVYDLDAQDYIGFLCTQGYTDKQLQAITEDKTISCSSKYKNTTINDLNYPSFALSVKDNEVVNGVFHRTLTNVGSPKSTYRARVVANGGLKINVDPNELSFTSLKEKKSFVVTIEGPIEQSTIISNSLVWDDGVYQVRSPIIVFLAL